MTVETCDSMAVINTAYDITFLKLVAIVLVKVEIKLFFKDHVII